MRITKKVSGKFVAFICLAVIVSDCKSPLSEDNFSGLVRTPVTVTSIMSSPVSSSAEVRAVSVCLRKSVVRAIVTGTVTSALINQGDYVYSGKPVFTITTREAGVMGSKRQVDSSLSFTGNISITAGKDGVVSSVSYQKGDYVAEGDELATISDQESLVFIAEIPFELSGYMASNRECTLRLPGARVIKGIVTGKLADMEELSQTVKYLIKPLNAGVLPTNLIATVSLSLESKKNATVLPKEALLANETLTEFWIMKLINDSVAVRVDVRKGIETNDVVEILDPLFLPSDRILLTGNYGLPDTAGVKIITR